MQAIRPIPDEAYAESILYADGLHPRYDGTASAHVSTLGGRYDYAFDGHDRLTAADYTAGADAQSYEDFSTAYEYNDAGAPVALWRKGVNDVETDLAGNPTEVFGTLDDLEYAWNGAQLAYVDTQANGLNEYDFSARRYLSSLAIWTTPDPLSADFAAISPYSYCAGNPIRFIDPSGCRLTATGDDIDELIRSINSKLQSLLISVDGNGNVSYSTKAPKDGEKLQKANKYDKIIKNIIDDDKLTVNATAQKSSALPDGGYTVGGSFMGNTYNAEAETVEANQTLVPSVLNKMSEANTGSIGHDIFHELDEAYIGAKISLGQRESSPKAGEEGSVYLDAHNRAIPQSGSIYESVTKKNEIIFYRDSLGELRAGQKCIINFTT